MQMNFEVEAPASKIGGVLALKWPRCAAARILSAPAARTHLVVAGSLFSCAWVRTAHMSYRPRNRTSYCIYMMCIL